jgi:cation diffusion facilitator family transporter
MKKVLAAFSTPKGAARLMLISVLTLFVVKVLVGILTDSISIWAQAADSSLDIFAVVITFLTISFSSKPADHDHPFGHGKVEDIAAASQAILLVLAVIAIDYSAVTRLLHGEVIQATEAGVAVMALSLLVSFFLSRHLFKVARASGSMALEANANNIRGDVFSTSGVFLGLLAVRITGLTVLDPIVALLVSLLILRAAYGVGKKAFEGLVDVRLPKEDERELLAILDAHSDRFVGYHRVRTRHSGSHHYIDLHMVMPRGVSVEQAHSMCDHLEADIGQKLANASVTIHVEPCDSTCQQCGVKGCDLRARGLTSGA